MFNVSLLILKRLVNISVKSVWSEAFYKKPSLKFSMWMKTVSQHGKTGEANHKYVFSQRFLRSFNTIHLTTIFKKFQAGYGMYAYAWDIRLNYLHRYLLLTQAFLQNGSKARAKYQSLFRE